MRSPLPFHIARPSESCTSGRQSTPAGLVVSEYQYIDVSGTSPSRAMSRRRNSVLSMSITTALPRRIVKR